MLLPLKTICIPKDVRRDGTTLIYLQYCYSGERRVLLNTEVGIPPNFWNKRKLSLADNLPLHYRGARPLNEDLKRMYRIAEDIVSYAVNNKIEDIANFVKKTFHPYFDVQTLESKEAAKLGKQMGAKTTK